LTITPLVINQKHGNKHGNHAVYDRFSFVMAFIEPPTMAISVCWNCKKLSSASSCQLLQVTRIVYRTVHTELPRFDDTKPKWAKSAPSTAPKPYFDDVTNERENPEKAPPGRNERCVVHTTRSKVTRSKVAQFLSSSCYSPSVLRRVFYLRTSLIVASPRIGART
jgi:hypothetical protein